MDHHYQKMAKVIVKNISAFEDSGFDKKQTKTLVDTTMDSIHVVIDPVIQRFDAMDKKIEALDNKISRLHYAVLGYVISLAVLFVSAIAFFRT